MSQETDKTLFKLYLGTYKPGRFANRVASELMESVRDNEAAGTLMLFGYEGLQDIIGGLLANIEELDREIATLKEILAHKKTNK